MPAGFTAGPATWDETSGVAERVYTAVPSGPDRLTMILSVGPSAAMTVGGNPNGTYAGTAKVGRAVAGIWHYTDPNNDNTTLRWAPRPGQLVELTGYGEPAHHLTQAELLAVARSVH